MGITSLFNILTIFYVFRSFQLLRQIGQQWQTLVADPLTRAKQSVAEQAAFFVAVPPGVFIHELGHALAVWLFGGTVTQFAFRFFWGYVVPNGSFTAVQDWFISLAGTLGSLVYGVALWLLLRHNRSATLRYFGLRAFRFQVYFSLIYYPIFTAILPIGDWRTIYNFGATPIASGVTAVFHLIFLLLFWYGDRTGWFEQPSFENAAEQQQFEQLATQVPHSPTNEDARLRLVDALRRGGAPHRAQRQLDQLLAANPNSSQGYLQRALLRLQKQSTVPPRVAQDLEQAIQLGLSNSRQITIAHQILGRYYLEREEGKKAIHHYDQALATAVTQQTLATLPISDQLTIASLYSQRSQVHRRLREYDLAYRDIQQAITLAQQADNPAQLKQYQEELGILEHHAGRSFGTHSGR